jgi:hypothetical protein
LYGVNFAMRMNEELLQYIWLTGLFNTNNLQTTDGQDIMILKRGKLNTDSGPDFSHARIKIDDAEWAGHIEIHIDSDDWYKHKHHTDKAYNNTILHVVLHYRKDVTREDGSVVPCIEISNRIHADIIDRYLLLKSSVQWVPCAGFLHGIDQLVINQMLDRVLINRLERKTSQVKEWLEKSGNDWHTTFYIAIARSFGFGTNSEAFEQMALHIPLSILSKHINHPEQVEALLFGIAGFLDMEPKDDYERGLRDEWEFFRVKYRLQGLYKKSFKFMRMRPGNFPTLRIAQFAKLISSSSFLLSRVMEEEDLGKIIAYFQADASEYWKTHYNFGKIVKPHSVSLSFPAIQVVLINAVVPVLYIYGQMNNDEFVSSKAVNLLHQIPSENNHIITRWSQFGLHARTAFDSQALLELKKNNCDEKKCLSCKIGNKVIGYDTNFL